MSVESWLPVVFGRHLSRKDEMIQLSDLIECCRGSGWTMVVSGESYLRDVLSPKLSRGDFWIRLLAACFAELPVWYKYPGTTR